MSVLVSAHNANFTVRIEVLGNVPDLATAQARTNTVKNLLTNNGFTIDAVNGSFQPNPGDLT